jgi:hypothetical protein
MGSKSPPAPPLIFKTIECRPCTKRQYLVSKWCISGDQDLTDLFSVKQPQAFRRVDQTFSTSLSTGSVGISEMLNDTDVLPCSCECGAKVLRLSCQKLALWFEAVRL